MGAEWGEQGVSARARVLGCESERSELDLELRETAQSV